MTTNPSTSSDFNPRSLAGATPYGQSFSSVGDRFQSTLPCGSDLLLSFQPLAIDNFNPRSLAGATTANSVPRQSIINFNPRSLAGATTYRQTHQDTSKHFNPRSLAGATHIDAVGSCDGKISIHAPLRERPWCDRQKGCLRTFQSTLPCGSDVFFLFFVLQCNDFNPRSLAGATERFAWLIHPGTISIHAPLRERPAGCCKPN